VISDDRATTDKGVSMRVMLAQVPKDDAEQLEHSWGVKVALEMLSDELITAMDFLWLCEEAAHAGESPSH
jgi:hypothetical protein